MSEDTEFERIYGRNAVREALIGKASVNRILYAPSDAAISGIVARARQLGVSCVPTDRRKLDALCASGAHQGILAYCSPVEFAEVEDLLELADSKGEKPFLVALDSVMDPRNFGAIIRSAYCSGAHGVIVAKRRSAPLSDVAHKASAGAALLEPIAQVANLARTLAQLKKRGLFVVSAHVQGDDYRDIDYDMPLVVVVGNEGSGVGKLIRDLSDYCAKIPLRGQIDSLNASVAAGILFFEAMRCRRAL
jgi:23S rRNA (guanosine2251-2'-O)-methyltransferase